jgi:hypothetical protein
LVPHVREQLAVGSLKKALRFVLYALSLKKYYDKELFQDRLEKPDKKQGAFFDQYRGSFRRHGRGDDYRTVDMG